MEAHASRTFAMNLVAAGCAVMAAVFVYFLVVLVLPSAELGASPLVGISATIITIFGVVGLAALVWTGARRRAWFWLVAAVLGAVIVLMNAPYLAYDIVRPADTTGYLLAIAVVGAAVALVAGGIAASVDVRRARQTWSRSGRAGYVIVGALGVVLGAGVTSIMVGRASAGAAGVADAPTTTDVVTIADTKFIETEVTMSNGDVLGLFVINRDHAGHSFDIDSLGIHVQLPPDSTTAIAIKPAGPGRLEFYCSVPGHREAGMVGTIAVE
jgi:plastocyanin